MRIYISGISGTGMGPLALLAKEAGIFVAGSDLHAGPVLPELEEAGIPVEIGAQDGEFLRKCAREGIDWFVYTSALPAEHAELVTAKELEIKVSKRDEFLAWLIDELGLKLVAVAGTHGKTTTTSMLIWACLKLGMPAAWLVGTTLPFAGAARYEGGGSGGAAEDADVRSGLRAGDKYFIYEADEYDRNFLAFQPWVAVIPFVSYDHPDIYATPEDYLAAFEQFRGQSGAVVEPGEGEFKPGEFALAGEARRIDAALAGEAVMKMAEDFGMEVSREEIIAVLNDFPGTGRRFEKIAEGIYSDYAHHPEEIRATIEMAGEEAERTGRRGVAAIYEPHQNIRQHEVFSGYHDAFLGASKIVWLPTYLVRENPELRILKPEEFVASLDNAEVGAAGEVGEGLAGQIREWVDEGYLVLLMTAGPADEWLREKFAEGEAGGAGPAESGKLAEAN